MPPAETNAAGMGRVLMIRAGSPPARGKTAEIHTEQQISKMIICLHLGASTFLEIWGCRQTRIGVPAHKMQLNPLHGNAGFVLFLTPLPCELQLP